MKIQTVLEPVSKPGFVARKARGEPKRDPSGKKRGNVVLHYGERFLREGAWCRSPIAVRSRNLALVLIPVLVLHFLFASATVHSESRALILPLGDSRTIPNSLCERYKLAAPQHKRVVMKEGSRSCQLLSLEEGCVELPGSGRPERIVILRPHWTEVIQDLYEELGTIEDLDVVPVCRMGDHGREFKLSLHGTIQDLPTLKRVKALQQSVPGRLLDNLELSSDLVTELDNRSVDGSIPPGCRVDRRGKVLRVSGSCGNYGSQLAEEAPVIVEAPKVIPPPRQATLLFRYIELTTQDQQRVGVDPGDQVEISTQGSVGSRVSPNVLSQASVGSYLDLIAARGTGEVSNEQALLCRNREKVQYHIGGELPIEHRGRWKSEVEYRSYGTELSIGCEFVSHATAVLNLEYRSSSPVRSGSHPEFISQTLKNSVELAFGESLVVVSTDARSSTRGSKGIPGLEALPLFGSLFRSNARHEESKSGFLLLTLSRDR